MTNPEFSGSEYPENSSNQGEQQYDELMAMLDEMQIDAHKQLRIEDKIMLSPLPEVLYHATTAENVESIQSHGLQPRDLMDERSEPVVSLSDSAQFALDTASVTQNVPPEELAVFEVTTQGQDRQKFRSYLKFTAHEYAQLLGVPTDNLPDGPVHEVHYTGEGGISPDFIYKLTPEELAAELDHEAELG